MRKLIFSLATLLLLTGAGCISFGGTAPTLMGIYRSIDKGETWSAINAYPTAQGVKSLSGIKVFRIFTDPSDHNALYMATRGQGLYYSYDRGDSWQSVPYMQNKFIYSVQIDPRNKCILYVTDGSNIYKSIDCSRTWTIAYYNQSGSKVAALALDYVNSGTVFAGLEDGKILQSQNGGSSWRAISDVNGVLRELVADPQVPDRMYAARATNGISRSDDNGQTWKDVSEGLKAFSEALTFYRFVFDPTQEDSIYWLSKYGIFHSIDAGETWVDLKLVTSPGTVSIYNFAINPKNPKELYYTSTVLTGGNQNPMSLGLTAPPKGASSKLYKSINGGADWFNRQLPSNAVPVNLLIHPDDPKLIFLGFTTVQ